MFNPTKFVRKPFYVDAVQVTDENMHEVAQWCGGQVQQELTQVKPYIKVRVHRPLNERQSRAFVGDWVLYGVTGGYKVYTPKAFENSFEGATSSAKPQELTELLTTNEELDGSSMDAECGN